MARPFAQEGDAESGGADGAGSRGRPLTIEEVWWYLASRLGESEIRHYSGRKLASAWRHLRAIELRDGATRIRGTAMAVDIALGKKGSQRLAKVEKAIEMEADRLASGTVKSKPQRNLKGPHVPINPRRPSQDPE